jgi:hypothetical protein
VRPLGGAPDADRVEAFVFCGDPLTTVAVERPLLSSTYVAHDCLIRAGLELWETEDAPVPMRLAGQAVGRETLGDLVGSFCVWRHEGLVGTGRYDIAASR